MSVGESFTSNAPLASWRAGVQPKTEASNQHLSAWLSWGSGHNFLNVVVVVVSKIVTIVLVLMVMLLMLLLLIMMMMVMMMMAV